MIYGSLRVLVAVEAEGKKKVSPSLPFLPSLHLPPKSSAIDKMDGTKRKLSAFLVFYSDVMPCCVDVPKSRKRILRKAKYAIELNEVVVRLFALKNFKRS